MYSRYFVIIYFGERGRGPLSEQTLIPSHKDALYQVLSGEDTQTDRRETDNRRKKLTWAFSSGMLKTNKMPISRIA